MKVVILAGGFGTRISEYTSLIPKPMIKIGEKPILENIMEIYSKFGHHDFYLALGYKGEIIKDYFFNYHILNSDFSIDLNNGFVKPYKNNSKKWKVNLIDTGINSNTGGRLLRLKEYIGNDTFLLTYGDALTDVNINEVINFHKNQGKLITVTAVRPPARFGEMTLNESNKVESFLEKPQIGEGWINGGFFVIEPEFFNYLENDQTILEKTPLEKAARDGEFVAFKHNGFWQCMDTKRDKETLEKLLMKEIVPWH